VETSFKTGIKGVGREEKQQNSFDQKKAARRTFFQRGMIKKKRWEKKGSRPGRDKRENEKPVVDDNPGYRGEGGGKKKPEQKSSGGAEALDKEELQAKQLDRLSGTGRKWFNVQINKGGSGQRKRGE